MPKEVRDASVDLEPCSVPAAVKEMAWVNSFAAAGRPDRIHETAGYDHPQETINA